MKFEEIYGSADCRELLGHDISTAEGMRAVKEQKLFETVCPKIVETSAKLLEQLIGKS